VDVRADGRARLRGGSARATLFFEETKDALYSQVNVAAAARSRRSRTSTASAPWASRPLRPRTTCSSRGSR
jgi:hypothetical protein